MDKPSEQQREEAHTSGPKLIPSSLSFPSEQAKQDASSSAGPATAAAVASVDPASDLPPPAALLAPLTSAHSLALADCLHRRAAVEHDASLSEADRTAALHTVDADVAGLLQGWGGEIIEVVSAWKAAREVVQQRGHIDGVMEQQQQSADALRAVREELRQLRERQAGEGRTLEEEMKKTKEEEQKRYMLDPACIDALMAKAKEVVVGVEDEEQAEVRLLVEQGITDPALLAITLLEQREQRREVQMAVLVHRHEDELAVLVQREEEAAEVEQGEAELSRRLVQVRVHEAMVLKWEQTADEEWEVQPEVVHVEAPGSDARLVRILRVDQHQLAALHEEHAEVARQHEAERQLQLEEVEARHGELAAMSDENWAKRVAATKGEHARQMTEEQRLQQTQLQRLLDELSARCQQQLRSHEDSVAEQRRTAMAEAKASEAAIVAEWESLHAQRGEDHAGVRGLGLLVAGLHRARQQRELEQLMDAMARDRLTSLTRALAEHRADTSPADLPSLQRSIRAAAATEEVAALERLQAQHRAELDAAFLRCGGDPAHADGPAVELRYAELAARAASIAEALEVGQVSAAAEVAEKRRRLLADGSMTDEEKARAMRGLLDGVHRFDEKQAKEAARQEEDMRRRMLERKQLKQQKTLGQAAQEKQAAQQAEAEHASKDEQAQAAIARAQQLQLQRAAPPVPATSPSASTAPTPPSHPPAQDAAASAQLLRVQELLRSLHSDALAWREAAYTDEADGSDARFIAEEGTNRLALVPLTSLTPSQAYLHRFTLFLLHSLHSRNPTAHPTGSSFTPPTLLLASTLPAPSHPCCAHRHVLWHDGGAHALCVRVERMEEVGRFVGLALHGMAHVMAEGEAREEVRRRAWRGRRKDGYRTVVRELKEEVEVKEGEAQGEAAEEKEEEERLRWELEEARLVERCWDDRDRRFLRHLQRLQADALADLFSAAAQPSSTASSLLPTALAMAAVDDEGKAVQEGGGAGLVASASFAASSAVLSREPVGAAEQAAAVSASPAALCTPLPHTSAARTLARLSTYSAFAQHSQLTSYLAQLEQQTAQRRLQDRAEAEERLLRVDPALARADAARWMGGREGGEEGGLVWLEEAEDELNVRLGCVVEQWWRLKAAVAAAEEGSAAAGADAEPRLREMRWQLAQLVAEKDALMTQLRHCQRARDSTPATQRQLTQAETGE